jgi:carboxylesterase type B
VQRNIGRVGGDPDNVTIAGESDGGIAVLAHLVARGSRRLFQRAIVESGSRYAATASLERHTPLTSTAAARASLDNPSRTGRAGMCAWLSMRRS